jgi:hypothetical protein
MTIERSHGKARPTLPRASDLAPSSDGKPPVARDAQGRFAAGNRVSVEARLKATLKRGLGAATDGDEGIVARDARKVMGHVLRALPSDAPPVRVAVTLHARHVALHALYTAKAEEAGLTSPEGLALLAVADRQSQRAERTLVTALDIATKCAAEDGRRRPAVDPLDRYLDAPATTVVEPPAAPAVDVQSTPTSAPTTAPFELPSLVAKDPQ